MKSFDKMDLKEKLSLFEWKGTLHIEQTYHQPPP